jgi:hypothetical protein
MVFPSDLELATGINSVTGKFLSSKISNILLPTKPVAPTTATFMTLKFAQIYRENRPRFKGILPKKRTVGFFNG